MTKGYKLLASHIRQQESLTKTPVSNFRQKVAGFSSHRVRWKTIMSDFRRKCPSLVYVFLFCRKLYCQKLNCSSSWLPGLSPSPSASSLSHNFFHQGSLSPRISSLWHCCALAITGADLEVKESRMSGVTSWSFGEAVKIITKWVQRKSLH